MMSLLRMVLLTSYVLIVQCSESKELFPFSFTYTVFSPEKLPAIVFIVSIGTNPQLCRPSPSSTSNLTLVCRPNYALSMF
jgi:hypothetical protein